MTLEDCKRIHRDMWNYIAGAEDRNTNSEDHSSSRLYLKDDFCKRSHLYLNNSCALCKYALDQYNAHNKDTRFCISNDVCAFCPVLWGTEVEKNGYYCESEVDGSPGSIDWRYSKASDIRDITWKDEVE